MTKVIMTKTKDEKEINIDAADDNDSDNKTQQQTISSLLTPFKCCGLVFEIDRQLR